jgi:hypothetical protein
VGKSQAMDDVARSTDGVSGVGMEGVSS